MVREIETYLDLSKVDAVFSPSEVQPESGAEIVANDGGYLHNYLKKANGGVLRVGGEIKVKEGDTVSNVQLSGVGFVVDTFAVFTDFVGLQLEESATNAYAINANAESGEVFITTKGQ